MVTNHRIIVADDEDGLRSLVAGELTQAGYIVESAADGSQAISLLRHSQFAAAVLDIKMPHVDGIEVLKFIHDNCPTTKVIMLTGYADLSHAMECMRYGAADFISKPFSLQDLLSTIAKVLQEQS